MAYLDGARSTTFGMRPLRFDAELFQHSPPRIWLLLGIYFAGFVVEFIVNEVLVRHAPNQRQRYTG